MLNDYLNTRTRQVQSLWQTYARLLDAAGSQKPRFVRSLAWAALSALLFGFALALLYPLMQALDEGRSPHMLIGINTALLLASIAARLLAERYDTAGHAQIAINELRTALGDKLRRIPLMALNRQRSGELSAVLVQSVNEAAAYAFTLMATVLYGLLIPLAAALALMLFDWRFALLLLLVLPLGIPLYLWRRRAFRRGFSLLAEANGKLKGEAVEFTQGLEVLKITGQTETRQTQFMHIAHDVAAIQRIGTRKGEKPNLIITATIQTGLMLVVALGAYWVADGSASWLLLATALIIIARTADVLNFFVQMSSLLEIFVIGAEKLQALMAESELPENLSQELPGDYGITLENVSYTYPQQNETAINHINMHIPARALTALVGGSGSGKTTLTRLILRHDDPQTGVIRIGGTDIRHLSQQQLMSLIAVVFQDVYLFQDSILNNIRMARPEATDDEVIRVARLAQCHQFISRLPEGYHTILADGGNSLSGGEKQRIAIARAILKDAPILILDEPTAALDTHNERAVQQALDALVGCKTVLVIAHRLSTVLGAQNIVVLEHGAIAQQGSHNTLMAAGGIYADFWRLQTEAGA